MNVLSEFENKFLIFDGGMGTMLQNYGLEPGELPEIYNITHPEIVEKIHRMYADAGADVISANTFGANIFKYPLEKCGEQPALSEVIGSAFECARAALKQAGADCRIALDIGPTGKLLEPLGTLSFEEALKAFAETVKLGVKNGAEIILIETMNDTLELKAAVLAAKENSSLPIVATVVMDEEGKLMTGADAGAVVALLEGLRVDALGINCGLGPEKMLAWVKKLCELSSLPVCVTPNAGLPKVKEGRTVYDVTPQAFAGQMKLIAQAGARMLGGCCGTTPEHIKAMKEALGGLEPLPVIPKNTTMISSYSHSVSFDGPPVLIGERLNPTGKQKLKSALREGNISYILEEALRQQEAGAMALDVNVGLPEIDEAKMLSELIPRIQAVSDLPLQIDTSDYEAMERAMRIYNGKPMLNSVCGKKESMEKIFPLAAKYGGVIVALTLDENGIPQSAQGRADIAKKIYKEAEAYGIQAKDIIIDALAMTISADENAANITLDTVKIINAMGGRTSLGVSNVSFGLPNRETVNSVFFAAALDRGLNAAIMNPCSVEMMKTYKAFCALRGLDEKCFGYIDYASGIVVQAQAFKTQERGLDASQEEKSLRSAVIKGLKDNAAVIAETLLKEGISPVTIIDEEIIPALNEVGEKFEKKIMFLPQLLASAEAAKAAFELIKAVMPKKQGGQDKRIVLATVKGDIHDIGKNIVRALLENYGFDVLDLGRDVPPEEVLKAVSENKIRLAGLSALMTTTVPAMEETIKLLHQKCPWCRVVVGGAVLTQEYADMIKADKYAKDAMETVRYAQELFKA